MKILYLFFYFFLFNLKAIDLNFECGGTFRIDKEFLLSDGSKYSQFSNYGTCSGELGIYNASYCFGTFKTKDNIVIDSEFLCENTFSDNEKAWLKARRIPNTELDSSLGEMIFRIFRFLGWLGKKRASTYGCVRRARRREFKGG